MANTLSKLTTAGNLYTKGTLDEATFNPNQNSYRKNLAAYSQDGTRWIRAFGGLKIISTNELAPDGTYTAVRVRPTATFSNIQTQNACWLPNISLIGSVWVRIDAGTRILSFGLNGGGLVTNFTATSNWQRFSTISYLNRVTYNDYFNIYDSNVSGFVDYIIWGWQVELGPQATIYEPTGANAIPSSNTLSKLDSGGNYYTAGTIDEVTFNPNQNSYRKNLLFNSQWIGGVSGDNTTGSSPTGYAGFGQQTGNILYTKLTTGNGYSCRFYGTNRRPFFQVYNSFAVQPKTNYVFSFDVISILVNTTIGDIFSLTYNFLNINPLQYYLNGILVTGSTPLAIGKISIVFSTNISTAVDPFTFLFRIGLGVNGPSTGDFVLANPQVEVGSVATIYEETNTLGLPASNNLSKLDTVGNNYLLGTYDEVTYNPNSGYIQNLESYSQQFNLSPWGLVSSTLKINTFVAPDGSATATKLQETLGSASTFYGVAQNPSFFIPGQTYTLSIYAKAAERTALTLNVAGSNAYAQFNLATGTVQFQNIGSPAIVSAGNGWYRCSITFKTLNTGSNLLYHVIIINNSGDQYVGTPGYGIYIWGAQLEIGNTPTTYVATGAGGIPLGQ